MACLFVMLNIRALPGNESVGSSFVRNNVTWKQHYSKFSLHVLAVYIRVSNKISSFKD